MPYESQAHDIVGEAVKVAVVLRWAPLAVRAMLRTHAQHIGNDYIVLRQTVMSFVMSGFEYRSDGSRVHGRDDGGTRAMGVGAVGSDTVCHCCGKRGHIAKDCWSKNSKGGKGDKDGKGKGYGAGKDGKSKGKGKNH